MRFSAELLALVNAARQVCDESHTSATGYPSRRAVKDLEAALDDYARTPEVEQGRRCALATIERLIRLPAPGPREEARRDE